MMRRYIDLIESAQDEYAVFCDWWQHDGENDVPSRKTYIAYRDDLLHMLVSGNPIFRGIHIDPLKLEKLEHIGVHWAELETHSHGFAREGSSNIYDDRFSEPEGDLKPIVMMARITDPSIIEIPETLAINLSGGESEIRLKPNMPIRIEKAVILPSWNERDKKAIEINLTKRDFLT